MMHGPTGAGPQDGAALREAVYQQEKGCVRDRVYVAGHGRLSSTIQQHLFETAQELGSPLALVDNWDNLPTKENDASRTVLVHAGSGRQLGDVLKCCNANRVPLIQCSTGITYPDDYATETAFPLIDAPNLSIPMIQFLYLLEEVGQLFHGYDISITESHQRAKTSPPGTALEMARLLGVEQSRIQSIRSEDIQRDSLGVPEKYLGQHALHIVEILADGCTITLRTEVRGLEAYLVGLVRILQGMDRLAPGRYGLADLIRQRVI
jgi:dihydrodipicolinate reductase